MARQLPNILTVVRIVLVPVLVVGLLQKSDTGDVLAAIVFCAASVTDALDGWLARRNDIVSNFGKLMDPIADKLLVISALLVLVSLNRLAVWVAMVIIAREFAVTVLRAAAGSIQGVVIPASQFGKLKTCFQIAMVLVLIIEKRGVDHGDWVHALVYVTVFVTVLSGLEYFYGALKGGLGSLGSPTTPADPPGRP